MVSHFRTPRVIRSIRQRGRQIASFAVLIAVLAATQLSFSALRDVSSAVVETVI